MRRGRRREQQNERDTRRHTATATRTSPCHAAAAVLPRQQHTIRGTAFIWCGAHRRTLPTLTTVLHRLFKGSQERVGAREQEWPSGPLQRRAGLPSRFCSSAGRKMDSDDEAPQLVEDSSAAAAAVPAGPLAAAATAASAVTSPTPPPASSASPPAYMRHPSDPPVPLTILTGWLGAGKTTLLTRILSHFSSRGQSLAIIQNEASSFGVEAGMKVQNQATPGSPESSVFNDLLELSNGCVCCSVKSDFILGVETLLARKRFDYIVLECSGLADPGPLVNTFWVDPELESSVYLDGVVSVVDAKNFLGHLRETDQREAGASLEAQQVIHQIAYADRVLLNKLDLVPEAEKEACLKQIALINQAAAVYTSTRSEVDLDLLLHIHAFDVRDTTRSLCMPPPLESDPASASAAAQPSAAALALSAHPHDRSISTLMLDDVSTPPAQRGLVDLDKLKQWLADLLWKDIKVTDGNKGEAQSYAATNAALGAGWTAAASAPVPVPAAAASSSPSSSASPPPAAASAASSTRPNSLFRVKAILRVVGEDQPMFLQAVQELYDIQPGEEWPETTTVGKNARTDAAPTTPPSRFTRFVFIGRRLDRASLEAGFRSIFVRPN